MEKSLAVLSEDFRRGLLTRRDFVQKVICLSGGVVAASYALRSLGFDADLIQEAQAQEIEIIEETGQYQSGDEQVNYFLARPRGSSWAVSFPTLIVIHEIFGLTEFIKNVARRFASQGYLAFAPELIVPPSALADGKHAAWMLRTLETGSASVDPPEIVKLLAAFEWLLQRPDADYHHIGSVGFCWGGARSFTLATKEARLWVAVVFYGSTPFDELSSIGETPVLGLYGALDNNSPSSITGRAAETARAMRNLGKSFEWEVYHNARHGFFRAADNEHVSEERPARLAWELVLDFLGRYS